MKKLCVCLIVLLLLGALVPTVSAEGSAFGVYDEAGLLTAGEEAAVLAALEAAHEETGALFFAATTAGRMWGDDFCRTYGYSSNENILLLIVTREGGVNYYDLYTYGDAYARLSNKEIDRLLDHDTVYDNIKHGSLADGLVAFAELGAVAYGGTLRAPLGKVVLISLIVALVVALITCGCVVAKYKMKLQPTNYPLEKYAKLDLRVEKDIFAGSFVTHRVIPKSSSSGGSRGGGRGGGGGHRGGR